MPIVAWKTLWAVDVCLFSYVCRLVRVPLLDVLIVIAQIRVHEIAPPKYALGICAAVGLIAGVAQIQRKLIVPWLCHAPIIIAKHLAHLTAVIAYSTQVLSLTEDIAMRLLAAAPSDHCRVLATWRLPYSGRLCLRRRLQVRTPA